MQRFLVMALAASVLTCVAGCSQRRPARAPASAPAKAAKAVKAVDPGKIQGVVIAIVAKQTKTEASGLTPKTSLAGDLKMDDLDMVETVIDLEEAFQISIPDDEAKAFKKIADLVDSVRKHVKDRSATRSATQGATRSH